MTPNASWDQCKALAEKNPTFAAPWAYSEVRYRWDMIDRRNLYDANGDFVCMVKAPTAETTDRDNLLAAAPDLLEALEELMRFHKGEGPYNFAALAELDRANATDDAWYNTVRAKIEAALAKARGQS